MDKYNTIQNTTEYNAVAQFLLPFDSKKLEQHYCYQIAIIWSNKTYENYINFMNLKNGSYKMRIEIIVMDYDLP